MNTSKRAAGTREKRGPAREKKGPMRKESARKLAARDARSRRAEEIASGIVKILYGPNAESVPTPGRQSGVSMRGASSTHEGLQELALKVANHLGREGAGYVSTGANDVRGKRVLEISARIPFGKGKIPVQVTLDGPAPKRHVTSRITQGEWGAREPGAARLEGATRMELMRSAARHLVDTVPGAKFIGGHAEIEHEVRPGRGPRGGTGDIDLEVPESSVGRLIGAMQRLDPQSEEPLVLREGSWHRGAIRLGGGKEPIQVHVHVVPDAPAKPGGGFAAGQRAVSPAKNLFYATQALKDDPLTDPGRIKTFERYVISGLKDPEWEEYGKMAWHLNENEKGRALRVLADLRDRGYPVPLGVLRTLGAKRA